MLYLIGTGLGDENDLTLRAIETMKKCKEVYIELFTNTWAADLKNVEKRIDRKVTELNRKEVESNFLIKKAKNSDIALLVVGDPLSATTHFELFYECKKQDIDVKIIHNASILTAIAETGLQLYKFGRISTLCFPEDGFDPKSPFEFIEKNKKASLHSLILLDIKPERQMAVKYGIELLLKNKVIEKNTRLLACIRLGFDDQKILYDTATKLLEAEEKTPAALVLPGGLNFKEEEYLKLYSK